MSVESPPNVPPAPGSPPSGRGPRRLGPSLSGLLGGLVVVAVGAVALATGIVHGHTDHVIERVPQAGAVAPPAGTELDARAIYTKDAPGVAFVQASGIRRDTPFGQSQGVATGSGFVLDRKGDILTNAHVVDGAQRVTVRFGDTGSEVPAKVAGRDDSNDLAVLRVDSGEVKLDPLPLGDSRAAHVGDPVAAIGNPFGFDRTITSGIVSALQRQITAPDGFTITHVIQTDAPINPGNSGGPLIDAHGRVIGITSQIATGGNGEGNVGIGFAVPIDTARAELPALERGATVEHAFLGVDVTPLDGATARTLGLSPDQRGALVKTVEPRSPAAEAGLRPGDVVVSLGGRSIADPAALAQRVAGYESGQKVTVGYLRRGERHSARVTLAARELTRGAAARP